MAHYPYLDANGNIICDAPVVVTGATTLTGALAVTGDVAVTGALAGATLPVTVGTAANYTPGATDSGRVYVSTATSGTQTYTLPAAAAGLTFTFVAGHADTEILITPATGDAIVGKTHGAENATGIAPAAGTGIKNTALTNVVGDFVTLVAANATTWYMTAVAGVWASQ